MGGHAVVRRALEDGDLRRLLGDLRDRLDGGRAGADHGHPLAREVHALVRPAARMVGGPLEVRLSGEVRLVGHRQAARGHDAEPGGDGLARVGGHRPAAGALVEMRRDHPGVEGDVPPQVEPVGHMVQVAQQLRLGGVALAPLPFVLQFLGEGIGIFLALDIHPGPGIAVPVPGAADPVAGLPGMGGQPHAPELVQEIEARKAGADNGNVEFGRVGHGVSRSVCCSGCCRRLARGRAVRYPCFRG